MKAIRRPCNADSRLMLTRRHLWLAITVAVSFLIQPLTARADLIPFALTFSPISGPSGTGSFLFSTATKSIVSDELFFTIDSLSGSIRGVNVHLDLTPSGMPHDIAAPCPTGCPGGGFGVGYAVFPIQDPPFYQLNIATLFTVTPLANSYDFFSFIVGPSGRPVITPISSGIYTFTAVPELSSLLLLGGGLAWLLIRRKGHVS
jgi:hypothetical protein